MKNPILVAVTGADGSGKSTACASVAETLNRSRGEGFVVVATIWDSILTSGVFTKEEVARYLGSLEGAARSLFLFHSVMNGVALARKKNPAVILLDGYFYKYVASELAYGVTPEVVYGACAGFEKPALTLCLEIGAEEAWKRKGEASRYESGAGEDAAKFIAFQNRMARTWADVEKRFGPWRHLPSGLSPEQTVDGILRETEALL